MAKKIKAPKLQGNALQIMAALMGTSNIGQDSLFRGRDARVTPEGLRNSYRGVCEQVTWDFAGWFCETEEMAQMAVDECKSWVKTLRKMSIAEICDTWPAYKPFVEALTAPDYRDLPDHGDWAAARAAAQDGPKHNR